MVDPVRKKTRAAAKPLERDKLEDEISHDAPFWKKKST
jgi:hypothetical protein